MTNNTYTLIDSGNGKKWERFGSYTIVRPASQAIWEPERSESEWNTADAQFTREGNCHWIKKIPGEWIVNVGGITFKLSPTDFGHLGIFPEQFQSWLWIRDLVEKAIQKGMSEVKVLNLFAYSGGSTLAAAQGGAHVCHLDASKGMVSWARENAELNHLTDKPIRWIVEDVKKFLQRELKRGKRYDAIVLDPPTFGRGAQGEVFKIETDLPILLKNCRDLLSDHPLFVLLSCHTPHFTPLILQSVLRQALHGLKGHYECGELLLEGLQGVTPLPSGTFARWKYE